MGYTSLWAHTPCFYLLCIQQQSNATYATYFSFCKAAVKLTAMPIAQPLRPILWAKAHIYYMIPAVCCCPSVLPRQKYIPFLMYSLGWGFRLFLNTTLEQCETEQQKSSNRGGTWGHGSPYRARGAEQTVQTGESLCSFTLLPSVWWAQTAIGT